MKKVLRLCTGFLCMMMLFSFCLAPADAASKKNTTLKAPSNFRYTTLGNKSVTLGWSLVSGAKGYGIFQYDSDSGTYKRIATITRNTYSNCVYTAKKLTADKTYRFYVKAYKVSKGKKVWGKASSVVSVKAREFSAEVKGIHGAYYNVKTKQAVTVTITSGKKKGKTQKLAKGTALTVTSRHGATVKGHLKNGTAIKIKRSALQYTGLSLQTKPSQDYSTQTKEDYVNYKGYSSPSKYLIWISQYKTKVNIFHGSRGKWKLIRTYSCTIGSFYHRTPSGILRIRSKHRTSIYGPYPIMYFSGGGAAFHYHNAVGMMAQAGKLNIAASGGCVRLEPTALWFICNNCPIGTTVVSL